jgi:hypothetical protein
MRRKVDVEKLGKCNQAGRQSRQLFSRQCIATLESGEVQIVSSKFGCKFLPLLDHVQFTYGTKHGIESNNSRNAFCGSQSCASIKWHISNCICNIVRIFSYVQGTRSLFARHHKAR